MIRIAFHSLKRQKRITFLFLVALISIIMMEVFLFSSLRTLNVLIEDDISRYGRGEYDLLVRPANSQTKVEQAVGLVEENYLSVGSGGISLATWEQIKTMKDVEIAAPVAALGYFTGASKSISLPIPSTPELYEIQFSTTDGVNTYPINRRSGVVAIVPNNDPTRAQGEDYLFDSIGDEGVDENNNHYMGINIMLPETYHLLVGIDPIAEEQLTDISFAGLHNPSFQEFEFEFAGDAPIIHVLQLEDANVSMELTIDIYPLPENIFDQLKQEFSLPDNTLFYDIYFTDEYAQALQEIKQFAQTNIEGGECYHYQLTELLTPFESEPFNLNDQYQLSTNPNFYRTHIGNTANYYLTSDIDYQINDKNNLTAKIVGEHEHIPIYRPIIKEGGTFQELRELPFALNIAGSYSIKEREEQVQVASSSLGLYYLNDIFTIGGKKVVPISTPGSFVPAPAHGVIDIHDAEIIKGEKPIDAIRIKVANINEYNEMAIQKIETLAKELHQLGLHVDVIAGASDQLIPITVENVGTVEQAWTTLGAATLIKNQWNQATFILTGLFFLVALFYIANRLMFWKTQKVSEVEVYHLLGWEEKEQRRILSNELNILYGFAVFSSLICLIILERLTFVDSDVYPTYLLVSSMLYSVIVMLRHRKHQVSKRQKQRKADRSMIMRNLCYYQRYMKLNSLQLFMTSMMSIFVAAIIWVTYQQSGITKLGEFINENLLILLLLLLLVSFGLALLTVTETITNFLSVRRNELQTLLAIGWNQREIWLLNAREISIWSIPAMLIGYIMGTGITILYYSFSWQLLWFGLGTFVLFALITLALMAWMITHELGRLYK